MKFWRTTTSMALGVFVTLGLLVLMYTLIDSGDRKLNEQEYYKIADFIQPRRQIKEIIKEELPEKPGDVIEPPPAVPEQQFELDVPANAVNIAMPNLQISVSAGLRGDYARDSDYIPIYVPQPMFPSLAQRRGVEGYAVVEVIITTTGAVRNPKLLEEYPQNYGFGKEALKASNKMKYNPRVIDGKPVEVPGVLYKFTFRFAE